MRDFSRYLANLFVQESIVRNEDQDILRYGIELFLTIACFCCGALVFGLASNRLLEVIVFLFSFFFLRCFVGGYHAKTPIVCWGLSLTLMISVLFAQAYLSLSVQSVLAVVSALYLIKCAPVVHPESLQYDKPRLTLVNRARKAVFFESCLILGFIATEMYDYAGIACLVVFSCSVCVIVKN